MSTRSLRPYTEFVKLRPNVLSHGAVHAKFVLPLREFYAAPPTPRVITIRETAVA